MKQSYLSTLIPVLVFSLVSIALSAQPTCDDPIIIISDDIEAYTDGDVTSQAAHWDVWPDATAGGMVTTEQAESGEKSIKIDAGIDGQDVLLQLGNYTEGHYIVRWDMFISAGHTAYFNLQHQDPAGTSYGFETYFDSTGIGVHDLFNDNEYLFAFPLDTWFTTQLILDLTSDEARLTVRDYTVAAWEFSNSDLEPVNELSSINFYPIDELTQYYIDNVEFFQIPEAETGKYCYTAIEVEPGIHTVPELSCYGGGYDLGGDIAPGGGEDGEKGYWFTYTPSEDGIISIGSCEQGVDTRGWIFVGECHDLNIVGVNDDQCLTSPGASNSWASFREAVVTAGDTYYILWDNAWESGGFDFELTFTTEPGLPGDFCQTAIAVQPGEHLVTEMDGDASVAGPLINSFTSSTTPYAQSEWYSFTPTIDGLMTITSCEGAASDTHVFVYTGDCSSFSTLNLFAQNDNGEDCVELQSYLEANVTAGTTYYIEWIDRWQEASFFWELLFEPTAAAAEVTFQVDMSLEDVDPDGVFLAGTFNGFTDAPMADDDGDGIYTLTLVLNAESNQEYKFKNGPDGWEDIDTSIGEPCAGGNFGNRTLDVGTDNITLDAVCFNYCVACNVVDVEEELLSQAIQVFPNPSNGQVNVRIDLGQVETQLNFNLLNTLGQSLKQWRVGSIQNDNISLDLTDVPAGAYWLQINDGATQISKRIIIQ